MKFIIFFISLLSSCICFSQSISGVVNDQNNQPCAYAEILVISKDSKVVKSALTDQQGAYDVELPEKGIYVLHVYNFGVEAFLKEITVNEAVTENISIDKEIELDAVTVTAKRKLVENKVDRLVYNVENSIASNGMDLTQVLSITPMLVVNDFGISIVGKSGVAVMVNGKMLNISGSDLINYLKSLRSENIAKIEVITTPPAKYEAHGNSGIINIVLKKNPKLGWSGNLSAAFMQTTYSGYSTNATLNYQSEKVSTSLRLRQYDRNMESTEEIDVVGLNSVLSADKRKDIFEGIGANLGLNYKVSDKSNMGFIYDIGRSHNDMDIDNATVYKTGDNTDSTLTTYSKHRNPILTQTVNVYHDTRLDDKGTTLSFVGNYFSNLPETEVNFETKSDENVKGDMVRNSSEIDYEIWSVQADFTSPLKWAKLETGAKFTSFANDSDVAYFNFISDGFFVDPTRSNVFEYDEKNIAGYLSLSKEINEKWAAKAGLRYEYSIVEGFSPTTNEANRNTYGKWFPTAYLSYKPNDIHSFSLRYSKRINRPSFRTLNPFRWYSNPLTYYTGNPVLQPSFNHNAELSYGFKGIFNLGIYGQRLIDGYGRTVELINGVEKVVNYDNYLTTNTIGVNASLFLNPVKWWETYLSGNTSYSDSKSSIVEVVPQQGFSAYYSIDNTVVLSKAKNVNLLINFWQSLPARGGNYYSDKLSSLSAGVRFPLLDKKLQVSAIFNDIFKGSVSRGEIYFTDFTQFYNNYYDSRRFTFSLTYNFGNDKVRGNSKRVRFDEKYRGN